MRAALSRDVSHPALYWSTRLRGYTHREDYADENTTGAAVTSRTTPTGRINSAVRLMAVMWNSA